MQSITEMVNASIDDMNYTEFQSVVSVCESLIENYEKAYEIIAYSGNKDYSRYESFIERFVMESDSFWRKNNKKGEKENILISILLFPLRLIQALIKLIRKSRVKAESQNLDKKLDKIEKLVSEEKIPRGKKGKGKRRVKSTKVNKNAQPQQPVSDVETLKQPTSTEVVVDTSGSTVDIESDVDINKTYESLIVVKEEVKKESDKVNELLEKQNFAADLSALKNSNQVSRKNAKKLERMLTSVTTDGKNRVSLNQYKTVKKNTLTALEDTEKVCKEYRDAIERFITILRDHPSGDSEVDDRVIKEMIELHKVSQTIVVATADILAILEANIAACNQAADYLLNRNEEYEDKDKEE